MDSPQEQREWKIRDAADVLIRAEAVKRDKKLMVEVRKELEKRKQDINSVKA